MLYDTEPRNGRVLAGLLFLVALVIGIIAIVCLADVPLTQYLVNTDGERADGYAGYEVVVRVYEDGSLDVFGVDGEQIVPPFGGWWEVEALIEHYTCTDDNLANCELGYTERFRGHLVVCNLCERDGDGDIDLADVADCLRRLTGPS